MLSKKGITVSEYMDTLGQDTSNISSSTSSRAGTKQPKVASKKLVKPGSTVVIELISRQKHKYVTHIVGLDLFGIRLKDASKSLSKMLACGATVSKLPDKRQIIIVQGDYLNELPPILCELYPEIEMKAINLIGEKKK